MAVELSVRHLSLMTHRYSRLLILMTILFCSVPSYGQEDIHSRRIVEFLQSNWEVRTETNEWQFTGKFIALPQQLEDDLLSSFPKHRFSLVEMSFVGHIPYTKYPLIVITDAQSGEVVGFIRQLNWGFASKSFADLFAGYQADNREDLENRLLVLGKLIASTDHRGSVGRIRRKKNLLSVEILWGGNTWRNLEAKFDRKFQIKKLLLINASGRRSFF